MSDKLTPKSNKCFFVRYPRKTKGYYFYNKVEGKVFVAHNGVFKEKEFPSKRVSGSKVQLQKIQETPKNILAPTDLIQEVQDVVPPDVEAAAPLRSIRAHRTTKKFTLLTTDHGLTVDAHHGLTMDAQSLCIFILPVPMVVCLE
jgi:hypothetical protein